jgi:hypothetical protein
MKFDLVVCSIFASLVLFWSVAGVIGWMLVRG